MFSSCTVTADNILISTVHLSSCLCVSTSQILSLALPHGLALAVTSASQLCHLLLSAGSCSLPHRWPCPLLRPGWAHFLNTLMALCCWFLVRKAIIIFLFIPIIVGLNLFLSFQRAVTLLLFAIEFESGMMIVHAYVSPYVVFVE